MAQPSNNNAAQQQPNSDMPPQQPSSTVTTYLINQKQVYVPAPPPQSANPADRHNYLVAIKAAARNLDFGNQNLLIIYKGTKQWWNIGGRSLLFYQYYLAPECELNQLNLRLDTDFYERWPANPGCASIRNIYSFTKELHAKANNRVTKLIKDPGLLIFQLDRNFNEEEIKVYLNIRNSEKNHTDSVLLPQNPFPGTRNACDLFNKALFDKAKNCEAFVRAHLVEEAFTHSNWLTFNFIAMSNGHIAPDNYFPAAFEHLNFIQDWLVHIQRYPVLDSRSRAKLAEQLIDLRQRLETDYKIIQARQAQSTQLSNSPDQSPPPNLSNQKSDKFRRTRS